jgi:calcium-dependent protein kinase
MRAMKIIRKDDVSKEYV